MTSNVTRRIKAGLIAFALVLSQVVLPVQSAYATQPDGAGNGDAGSSTATENKKVFVCKYVTTPDDDEVASHIISVSVANKDYKPGDLFVDAQGMSYVVAFDNGQAEPSIAECPRFTTTPVPTSSDPCNPASEPAANNVVWSAYTDTDKYYWTLNIDGSLTVTAKDGYLFKTSETSYESSVTYTLPADSGVVCEVSEQEVPLPIPLSTDPCGLDNASWQNQVDTTEYTWMLSEDGRLIVTANTGFYFVVGGQEVTSHDFGLPAESGVYCIITTPETPGITDECNVNNVDNAFWIVPGNTDTITWAVNSEGELIATALGDNAFEGGQKTHNYGVAEDSGEKCVTECTVTDNMFIQSWTDGTYQYPYVGGAGSYSFQADGLHLSTPAISSYVFGEVGAGNTPIRDIDDMSYKTLREVTSMGNPQVVTAYILSIDRDGDLSDASDVTYLFYEPIYNGTVVSGIWQTWDVDADNAKFWSFELTDGNPTLTWSQIVTDYPDAVALTYGFNQGTYNQGTNARIQDLVFDCATTSFGVPGSGGGEEEPTTPLTPTTPNVPATPAGGAGVVLPAELPLTGENGSMLFTWIALLAAILTYGAVYHLQPKKRFEEQ